MTFLCIPIHVGARDRPLNGTNRSRPQLPFITDTAADRLRSREPLSGASAGTTVEDGARHGQREHWGGTLQGRPRGRNHSLLEIQVEIQSVCRGGEQERERREEEIVKK